MKFHKLFLSNQLWAFATGNTIILKTKYLYATKDLLCYKISINYYRKFTISNIRDLEIYHFT